MREEKMLDDLLEVEAGLTGWEMDFLESLDRTCREHNLTEKQADRLKLLWEKKT